MKINLSTTPPDFFAELEYRLRPTQTTLEKWCEVIDATVSYLADCPTRAAQGVYHLEPGFPGRFRPPLARTGPEPA